METMKEITVNINGMGGMTLFRASRALKDESQIGHDIVVTSGEDGVVYLTDLTTESVVSETVVCDGAVPSCAVTPEQTHLLVVQEEDNALYSYALPTGSSGSAPQLDKLLFRSTVAIRHVVCSTKYIAIADEEAKVKVLVRGAAAAHEQLISIDGHSHGIKSVAIDPTEQFVCSSSEDGTVRVFELHADTHTATERAVFKTQYADMTDDDVVCRCAWQRGTTAASALLAVPANQGVIELYARSSWTSAGQLLLPIGKSTPADINIVTFSPNGMYVAAATLAKQVFVWSVATKEVLRSFKLDYAVLALEWALTQNALVVFHAGGKFGFVKDVIAIGRTPPQVLSASTVASADTTSKSTAAAAGSASQMVSKKRKQMRASSFIDDEAGVADAGTASNGASDDDDDDNETRVEAIKASFGFGQAAANASALLDDDVSALDGDDDDAARSRHHSSTSASSLAVGAPLRTFTEPFQSGSVQDGAVCLLAWTPVGEIETIRGASGSENLVKVEFADKARRGFKFSDQYVFTMACLDDHGAFFGVPRRARDEWDDDAGHGGGANANASGVTSSYVFYRPFESWANNSSWHLALPEGEDAECVAAAAEFCAVATSLHCLRIYTTSGIEYALLRLPGRIVTMAARATRLAVVYQELSGALAFQLLRVRVHASAQRVVQLAQGHLPLSPPPADVLASHRENELARADVRQWSTLTWLSFDDRGVVYAVDSLGCVQALSASVGWNWFPIGCVGNALNKKPGDRTGVFPLGIVNESLLYFPLEKGARTPKLRGKHRPVPLTFALRTAAFPKTVNSSSGVSGKKAAADAVANVMWQNVRVHALEANNDVVGDTSAADIESVVVHEHAEMDKALILMMKTACANDEPARVLDLAKCLHLEKSHQIAQKLAIHFGLRQLQSELYALYYRTFEAPQQQQGRADHDDGDGDNHEETQHTHAWSQTQSQTRVQEPLVRASLESKALLSRRAPRGAHDERESAADAAASYSDHSAQDDEAASTQASSSFFGKSEASLGAGPAPSGSSSKPVVERSVAPANPFLKKPAAGTAGGDEPARSGLGRLAKFSSPPPMKKRKAGWK